MDTDSPALSASLRYLKAGLSVGPVRPGGDKSPDLKSWKRYQTERPTEHEVRRWHWPGYTGGVCVFCGAASGNLAVLDFEFTDVFDLWLLLVEQELPGLVATLPQVLTPGKDDSRGRHIYLRTPEPVPCKKLAWMTADEAVRRTGDAKKNTLIEVKAHGGYVLAPGCPACCHPSGRLYEQLPGLPLEEAPCVTAEQYQTLCRLAAM